MSDGGGWGRGGGEEEVYLWDPDSHYRGERPVSSPGFPGARMCDVGRSKTSSLTH